MRKYHQIPTHQSTSELFHYTYVQFREHNERNAIISDIVNNYKKQKKFE